MTCDADQEWDFEAPVRDATTTDIEAWTRHTTWGCLGANDAVMRALMPQEYTTEELTERVSVITYAPHPGTTYGGVKQADGRIFCHLGGRWLEMVFCQLIDRKIQTARWPDAWDSDLEFDSPSWFSRADVVPDAVCAELGLGIPRMTESVRVVEDFGGSGHFSFSGYRIELKDSDGALACFGFDECRKSIQITSWVTRDWPYPESWDEFHPSAESLTATQTASATTNGG